MRAEVLKDVRAGDRISVTGHKVGDKARTGEVLEVLGEAGHEHLRVRWEDGHESIFYPGEDATIEHVTPGPREEVR